MPPFTYTPDVPQAQTPMNITQPQILENFKAISELIAVNHVDFNLDGIGFHNVTMMPNTTAPATPETTGITMYTAATGSPNPSEIFGQYPDASTVQISGQSVSPGAPSGSSGAGWCMFTSGIKMQWGTGTWQNTSTGQSFYTQVGVGIPVISEISFIQVVPNGPPATPVRSSSFINVAFAGFNASTGESQVKLFVNPGGAPTFSTTFTYTWFVIGS